jgi:hypothetical protein
MSEREILNGLFRKVCKYGYYIKKYRIDGKKAWNDIEKQLTNTNLNIYLGGWNPKSYSFYQDLLNLGVLENIRPDVPYDIWLYNHFLLQHGRLAKKECYLNRILQIAYNSGQLAYCLKHSEGSLVYTHDRILYYVSHNLNNLESYINIENIKLTSEIKNSLKNLMLSIDEQTKKITN